MTRLRAFGALSCHGGEPWNASGRALQARNQSLANVRPRRGGMGRDGHGRCRNGNGRTKASSFCSATRQGRDRPLPGNEPGLVLTTRVNTSLSARGHRTRVACTDDAKANPRTGRHGGLLHAGSKEGAPPLAGVGHLALTPDGHWDPGERP